VTGARESKRRADYHSPLRARQAAQTREVVLAAATRLFTERGWAATTLAAVAEQAGTAVETVYAGFRSKSGLLTAVIDAAIVGDDEPVPLAERSQYAQLDAGSRQERLAAAAHLVALTHDRSVALLRTLQEAAASDSAAAARWAKYEDDRRTMIAGGLGLVLGRRAAEDQVDAVWAIASPEVFGKLVMDRGWSVDRYQQWLVEIVGGLVEGTIR
jgi:AcrR family transcriptional regulator